MRRIQFALVFVAIIGLLLCITEDSTAMINSNPIKDTNTAKLIGVIPYGDNFITKDEVKHRHYAITSYRMIDTTTVAVLTGNSDEILVYSLSENQILYKIQLPISAIDFEYKNDVFHVISDHEYFSIDKEGHILDTMKFNHPNQDVFIITDLYIIDGQPVIHESNSKTFTVMGNTLKETDTSYYRYADGYGLHPKYINENDAIIYIQTPYRSKTINISMEDLGIEGQLACLDHVSINADYIAINLQTSHNRTGRFVKSYLLILNLNGEIINLIEVPVNFLSYISKAFLFYENDWYYAFSGKEGISFYQIGTQTNLLTSPDSHEIETDTFDFFSSQDETIFSQRDTANNSPTRGNWRTITQAWYNANKYCTMEWTPIWDNIMTSCYYIQGGYIRTYISNTNSQIGVPYKWGGYTDWTVYKNLALLGKYTGNINKSSCSPAHHNDNDEYVIGVDCSGFVSRCWEVGHYTTSSIPNICTDYGYVQYNTSSSSYQKGDALNDAGSHVMMYTGHNSSNQIQVFESSANDWKTSSRVYLTSFFSGTSYKIQRLNYMKNIILRLGDDIELRQNGSTVTNVTQGQPLTVYYSVYNAGSETWAGYVSLWIETSDGNLIDIQDNDLTSISAGNTQYFTFSNNGVSSPVGTTKFYVKVENYNASDYGRFYDVGSLTNSNPKVFQIVAGSGGGSTTCNSCPNADEAWNANGNVSVGEWTYKSSSIASGGCYTYKIPLMSSYTYTFRTSSPGSANFDTYLYLYDTDCYEVASNDDYEGTQSSIEYTNTGSTRMFYLKVAGYGSASGSFTLAVKRECPLPNISKIGRAHV